MNTDRIREQNEKWLDSDPWDIAAVFPANTSKTQVHEMLRNLLTETFGLVQHSTYKETGTMELIADPRGTKLKEAPPEAGGAISLLPGRIVGHGMTTKSLASIGTSSACASAPLPKRPESNISSSTKPAAHPQDSNPASARRKAAKQVSRKKVFFAPFAPLRETKKNLK